MVMKRLYTHLLSISIAAAMMLITYSAGAFAADEVFTVGGFPVTVENYSFGSKNGVTTFRGKGTMDLSSALGSGVVLNSEEVTVDSTGKVTLKNASYAGQFLTSGGVKGKIETSDIDFDPNSSDPLKIKAVLLIDIADTQVEVAAVLPVTSQGIRNTTVALLPKQGEQAFFSYKNDAAEISFGSGSIDITDGKLGKPKLSGSMKFMGSDVSISNVSISPAVSGSLSGTVAIGSMRLTFPQGSSFSYSVANGFRISASGLGLDVSKVLPGVQQISVPALSFADGVLSAEADVQQTIPVGKASISLGKMSFSAAKSSDGSVLLKAVADGSVALGSSGPNIEFKGLEIDSAGNVAGKVDLNPPQTLTLLGVDQTISSVQFSRVKGTLTVGMAGSLVLGSDSIAFSGLGMSAGKLTGDFDVSDSKPFSFSGLPYLKLTNVKIDNDVLKVSGQIDVPDPVSYSFKFNDIQIDKNGNFIKQATTAVKSAWNMVNDPSIVTFENKNPASFSIGGVSFNIDAISLPNPIAAAKKGQFPDTLLKVYLRGEIPIGGTRVAFKADGIEVTKTGVKDVVLNVTPPVDQTSFAAVSLAGFSTLSLSNAKLEIADKKIKKFDVQGSLKISMPSLTADVSITVDENKRVTGNASLGGNPLASSVGGLGVSISSLSFTTQEKDDISVTLAGSLNIGSSSIGVNAFTINKDGVSAEFDVSQSKPFSFSWFPLLKVTQFKIDKSELAFGGSIDIPDPINYKFSFQDVKLDMNGDIKSAVKSAASGAAKNAWDKVTASDLITIVNTNTSPVTVMGLSFSIDAISLPNPMAAVRNKKFPDTLLALYMKGEFPLAGSNVSFNINGLEVTKNGLKDLSLDIMPPDGQESFFSMDAGGFATVKAAKAKLEIKDHKFQKINLQGTLDLKTPSMKADVEFTVASDRKVTGSAVMDSKPLALSLCGLDVSLTKIEFAIASKDDLAITLAGSVKIGSDELAVKSLSIDKDGLSADFGISADKPFSFSWLPYLKLTKFEIEKSQLTFGGSITSPDPVKYTFAFQDVAIDLNGSVVKQVKGAAADTAKKAWEKVASDDLLSIVNTNKDPVTIAGFSFYIDALTVPNPVVAVKKKSLPDTLLSLYMRCDLPLGDVKIPVNIDGLEITKAGIKDVTITIAPPDGKSSVYSATILDWAAFSIDSASLVVKNKKFESFTFAGSVKVDSKEFKIASLNVKDGAMSGKLQPVGDAFFKMGGVKLSFGEVNFSAAGAKSAGTGDGGGGPQASSASSAPAFSISLKSVTLDLSEAFGSDAAKFSMNEISYADGKISADISTTSRYTISGIAFELKSIHFESDKPAANKSREFTAMLAGGVKLFNDAIKLDIKDFKVSSSGEFGGIITPEVAQSFDLYIMSFAVSKITVEKKSGDPISFTMAGSFKVGSDTKIDFDNLKFANGNISFSFTRTEAEAIALPLCNYVKLTEFELADGQLKVSGFVDVPLLGFRMVAEDIAITTRGKVSGGTFKLASSINMDFGPLKLSISSASLDLKTKIVSIDGGIKLPENIISGDISFEGLKIYLSVSNSGSPAMGSARSTSTKDGSMSDKKHGFPLTVSYTSLGFSNGKLVVSMGGSLKFLNKFTLNFDSFSVAFNPADKSDVSFNIGSISGSIEIATFKLTVTEFKIDDSVSDPFVRISGGLSLPSLGSVSVTGLEISKSGRIKLEGVSISVDKGAYRVKASISYVNETFKGDGKLRFGDKDLAVSVLFSSKEFSIDISVSGLGIVIFPGITLEGIGGGIHCVYSPLWLEFKISGELGLGSGKVLKGRVELIVNTDGVITVNGSVRALDMFNIGEASITIDTKNQKVSGYGKVVQNYAGLVTVTAQVNFYFGLDTWYVKGTGNVKVISYDLGQATLDVSSSGLFVKGDFSYSSGRVSASVKFSISFYSLTNISASFSAKGSVTFWKVTVSASLNLTATFNGSELSGSAGVRGCIDVWIDEICVGATVKIVANSGGLSFSVDW